MQSLIDALYAELSNSNEEGETTYLYDDATGKRFVKGDTLVGNLTIATGVNLMVGMDAEEVKWISEHRMQKVLDQLNQYAWFATLDQVRQIAVAAIAFNIGLLGLLHWPKFLADMVAKDYNSASSELRNNTLWVSQVKQNRASRIELMISSGNMP